MVSGAADVFPHNKQAASAAILDNFNNFMLPHEIRLSECSLGTALAQILVVVQLYHYPNFTQIVVATQSSPLVDMLEPENIIVTDMQDGASCFERLQSDRLRDWLSEYTLSQLWEKNVIGGRP